MFNLIRQQQQQIEIFSQKRRNKMTENKYLFEKRKNSQKKINKNKLNKKNGV